MKRRWPVASGVKIDEDGNIQVTGFSLAFDGSEQYATVKYDRLGNELQVELFTIPSENDDD